MRARTKRCAALALAALLAVPAADARISVRIEGIDGRLEDNVRALLDVERFGTREDLSAAAVQRLYGKVPDQVRSALRPYGYYEPEIETELSEWKRGWRVLIRVEPGPAVRFDEVDVEVVGEGADLPALRDVVDSPPFAPGDQLNHPAYDALRNRLSRIAQSNGFLDARFETRRLAINPVARTADVELRLDTGPRYSVGEVTFEQDILRERLVERLVYLEEGDPYSLSALLETQYALNDSGYFAATIVEPGKPDPESRTVPVTIDATPVPKQRIRVGVGYGTDSRFRLTLGWDFNRLNRRGHRASVQIDTSQTTNAASLRYLIPVGNPLEERFVLEASYIEEELADTRSDRLVVGGAYRRSLGDWQATTSLELQEEETRLVEAVDGATRTTLPQEARRDTLVLPKVVLEQLVADDLLDTRRGHRYTIDLRGSHGVLGSDAEFLRLELEGNWIMPLGDDYRLQLRAEGGFGMTGSIEDLPASQRFFAGGDLSVRGFDFNTLGPRDEAGRVIGGKHRLFGSVELERHLFGRWYLAAFVDTGNAFNDFSTPLETSVGLGLHVKTPVGRVRLELAEPLTDSRGPRVHITIRPDL
jgi:translocation and assembly module TamA